MGYEAFEQKESPSSDSLGLSYSYSILTDGLKLLRHAISLDWRGDSAIWGLTRIWNETDRPEAPEIAKSLGLWLGG
jgi:hypothetical protein